MHGRSHLYVGFRAYDPEPSAIRAHLSDRDAAWNDDWAGVVLDTFNDERRNYLLAVNPLGVQMDTIEAWPGGGTVWDGIWDSGARIRDWGWSAELKIPFSTLRFQRSDTPQIWGFDAIRGYPRNVTHQTGAFPRDRSNNCYLCQAIKIEGCLEAGVTARWGFTPNLTLAATLNPDFSQVEADARQLDINEPFALFFPEKRPFFMEGADFFDTPLDIVYTRTVRDPSWGLKLTGKEGEHTVGSYVVQDDITNLIIPGSQSSSAASLDLPNTAAVARYKLDLGSRYTLGALLTSREGESSYFNRVAGIDGDLRLSERDRVTVQLLGSSTRYPEQVADEHDQPRGSFDDWAGDLLYSLDTRTWSWWGQLRNVGRDFRADLGFMPRVDYRHGEAGLGYNWNAREDSWYSRLDLKVKAAYTEDSDGNLLRREDAVHFTVLGPLQSHSYIRPSREREGYNGQEFDLTKLALHVCMNPDPHSHVWFTVKGGDQVDYVNTQAGERLNLNPGFWYRFGRHLRVELSHNYETMDVDDGWLYEANVSQATVAWQFTARAFVRTILQYVDYEYNPEQYTDGRDSEYQNLFSQLLFSYKVNPRTVFFLGYSDNSFANQDFGLERSDRTVFVKIGYAWVL